MYCLRSPGDSLIVARIRGDWRETAEPRTIVRVFGLQTVIMATQSEIFDTEILLIKLAYLHYRFPHVFLLFVPYGSSKGPKITICFACHIRWSAHLFSSSFVIPVGPNCSIKLKFHF